MQWGLPKNPMDGSSPVMRDRGQGGSRSASDEKAVYGTELQRVRARSHNAWEASLKGYMEGAECARIAGIRGSQPPWLTGDWPYTRRPWQKFCWMIFAGQPCDAQRPNRGDGERMRRPSG
jgi:hypothetical protein